MRSTKIRQILPLGFLAAVLAVTGCGDSSGDDVDSATPGRAAVAEVSEAAEEPQALVPSTEELAAETDPAGDGVPPTERLLAGSCVDLAESIAGADSMFATDELVDVDPELSQQVEDLLAGIAKVVPDSAPPDAAPMLEAAAAMLGAVGDAATTDDPLSTFRRNAAPAQARLESIDWEPTEAYFEDECGVGVVGIELKLRSDNRTSSEPAISTGNDDTKQDPTG